MISTIGHNSGQVITAGHSWRKHVWTKARKDLMPTLPIEVVRLRVKRATQLGMPYKTYAGIRASTGHDLIGFLFSNNALHILRDGQPMPQGRAEVVNILQAKRIGVANRPVTPTHLAQQPGLDAGFAAPAFTDSWVDVRDKMVGIIRAAGYPADRFVMIGDTAFEREWMEAGRMAAYLPAGQFFNSANP